MIRPFILGLVGISCTALATGCSSSGSGVSGAAAGGSTAGAPSSGGNAGTLSGAGGGIAGGTTGSGGAQTGEASGSGGQDSGGPPAGAGGQQVGGAGVGGAGAAGAGATGAGAGGAGAGGAAPSSGCGSTMPPASGRFTIDVDGAVREYILAVPDGYDSNQPHRLIFGWHPRGGSADSVATGFGGGYYGLESRANGTAIFVAPEGIDAGWANTGGRDIALLRAMLDRFTSELCIDESRIFSTGFSYGGMMSFAVGCAMGDVFRAIAPMSGALYSGCEDGDHPIAMWGAHGDNDTVVPLENGESARDVFLERNHCQTDAVPVDPSPCVSYQGCDAGYPVVWCEFSGGHTLPSDSGQSIWDFFSQF